jgi:HSP20 family protein
LSSGDIEPFDWFNRFFGGRRSSSRAQGSGGFPDIFRGFDEMGRQMEREFQDMFKNIETNAPKDLIREYETSEGGYSADKSLVSSEREPLADVTTTDKEVKVVVEMPGVGKENIMINAYDNSIEVTTTGTDRKYHEVIDLPEETDIETARSTYKNGILEITFNKKQKTKPEGKQINIE